MRCVAVGALVACALALAASASAASLFLVRGQGWGHGIGMSQYGALGFAQNGSTYDAILAHYYPGTQLGSAPGQQVRVLLASGRKGLSIGSPAPFTVVDAQGASHTLEAGTYELAPDLVVQTVAGPVALAGPVRFEPGGSPLELGRPYRGAIVVSSSERSLSAVNYVGLEQYLYGVVPREMPADWLPEALKAQAVAARSYALAEIKGGGPFDLFADARSQVYGGISAEDARTSAATDATAGQVLLYEGQVASTFFYSTSGGRTAAITDVWPAAQALPYLVSVDDPYDSISPYNRWGPLLLTAEDVVSSLAPQLPTGLVDLRVARNASGRVSSVTASGAGGTMEIPAGAFQGALGLRSTSFDVGVLALSPEPNRVVLGQPLMLAGVSRGVGDVRVEQRAANGVWEQLGPVAPKEDGTFTLGRRPRITTYYRLTWPEGQGATIRVPVAARIELVKARRPGVLKGLARPKLKGAVVEVQRLRPKGWKTVATATLNRRGEFRAELELRPGTYRAWFAPGSGLVPGASVPLEIAT